MLIPTFKTDKSDRLMLSDRYLCNGKWLVTRDIAKSHSAPNVLSSLLNLKEGVYPDGIRGGWTETALPDFAAIFPKREGYSRLGVAPIRAAFRNETAVHAYVYQGEGFEIGIAVNYVPLLNLGVCFAKDALSPILILDSDDLNGNLVGLVMPMRLN